LGVLSQAASRAIAETLIKPINRLFGKEVRMSITRLKPLVPAFCTGPRGEN